MVPEQFLGVLAARMLLWTLATPAERLMEPPAVVAWLAEKVLLVMLNAAELKIAPPCPMEPEPPALALLPANVQLVMVNVPAL